MCFACRPYVEWAISGEDPDPNRTLADHHLNNVLAQKIRIHFKITMCLRGVDVLLEGYLVEVVSQRSRHLVQQIREKVVALFRPSWELVIAHLGT